VQLGWRTQGGFVGAHDRKTGAPIPDHISARQEDISTLIQGMLEANQKLARSNFDPVLAAAIIAFGFVFIHPFTDGNGRLHRYLIHHVLAQMNFTQKGTIFPVSSAILQRIGEYREVLESYSGPRLDFIKWKPTKRNNIEILNDTADLYRYFDATKQAEFLYSCVEQTIREIIPEEVEYLCRYDKMKAFIDEHFEMPNITADLLIRFLAQGNGKLSKRARNKEFDELTEDEIAIIESAYSDIFKP
jgi:Fic family protein